MMARIDGVILTVISLPSATPLPTILISPAAQFT
jgi:hypothetical protein